MASLFLLSISICCVNFTSRSVGVFLDVGLDDDEYWVAWTLGGISWIGFRLSSFSDDFDFFGLLDAEASVDDFLGRPLKLRILELLNFRKNTENYLLVT